MTRFSLAALAALLPISAQAAPIPLSEIVNRTTTSTGYLVGDGLSDAFDGAFYLYDTAGLSVNRDIATLESHYTYRVLDIFTNNSSSTITTTVRNYTNLGSDGGENVVEEGANRSVTFEDYANDGTPDYDPVLAFSYGSGSGAPVSVFGDVGSNRFDMTFDLTLEAGESVGILYYATLIRDASDRSGDIASAQSISQGFLDDPFLLSGLTSAQIATVGNFGSSLDVVAPVPLPAGMPLLLTALGGAAVVARKRKA
jgi:hypothetical protein